MGLISIIFVILALCHSSNSYGVEPKPFIMSHRGLYQTYHRRDITTETCTAERIDAPVHGYLENTIPSMARAFELGAFAVELDVHATVDGKIVVFHDWTLECRTNGSGKTEEQTFEYLRSLDIGYGYTHDDHRSHPFRCVEDSVDYEACRLRNRMPTLREVFRALPKNRFVINMKSKNPRTLDAIINELKELSSDFDLSLLSFYVNHPPTNATLAQALPMIKVPKFTLPQAKVCIEEFLVDGTFSSQCRDGVLGIPYEELVLLGEKAKGLILAVKNTGSEFWVLRVDTAEAYDYVRSLDVDGIWTDRIDIIGPRRARSKTDEKIPSL